MTLDTISALWIKLDVDEGVEVLWIQLDVPITELIKEDSPFGLTRAVTRIMIGLRYTPLSLVGRRWRGAMDPA